MDSLVRNSASINEMLTRYGVKFGLYKNGSFHEQIFPFDPIARTIEADEWKELSAGLAQRVRALNAFLLDIYGKKRIIMDGVIPPEFVFSSPGFLKACDGVTPPGGVYTHMRERSLPRGGGHCKGGVQARKTSPGSSAGAFQRQR